LSETGKRVILEVRGEVLSAPAEKGDVRNITHSPAVADRDRRLPDNARGADLVLR
jgi:tricorn protease